ncbi:rho GTPase-activating protein 20 isoform X1 [Trachemys scripta elegans]|uniref:rho GTPase-activating protein 20 isoform X1 n=1 Tax=Trachemys scripta elegans TaxID=31138 RepID=UPI00155524D1|nr:rho GTPase-activating protein 20 isoform X1 [Trachemys scripta elegans]
MEAMSPQQDHVGQGRSSSVSGESRASAASESKKKMKSLAQRRQSAPSLVLSKALNKSRTITRESCFSPISPEACPLVQSFICPNRAFVLDGHVQLKTGLQTQERHLFLFTDILVVAKSKSPSHFKLKSQVRLCEMWTASCMEEVYEGSTNPERSFVIGWPTTNCVANFSSPEQKEKWLSSLQSRIKEEKEKDYPKNIPLKIIAKDVGNCAYSKTFPVTNADTANDVILTALQQLGINGSEKDYQLWVNSGKEDAPYPLIGHEYPFGIKMSHIRDAVPQIQESKDCAYPLDLHGSFLMEQLPRELQCQFILKPSRLALCEQLNELSQKPFKRKKSIINWAFWRGPGTQLDNIPLSPTSPVPGKLFGLSLPAICENDNLPKPVLDMLSFLYKEGPFTRGIFRRSANAKSCRELKEKLNLGAEVHLACESIFVTASVFKDFLRNIPGSIFSSQLCDKWVSVMDQGNHEEKIKDIQRLIEQLPRANVVLLRYLFGVLHSIEKQSEDNQMTAFNLAVCIAPSMLWPPAPSSPETESEFTKKVSVLVQFLIENCCRIFGEEISTLFGDILIRCDNREDGSDLSSFHLNDSSYDSLENELNDDVDSSFSDLLKKRGQDNRSRDSVLTLSDCDLDQPEVEEIKIQLPPKSKPVRISTGSHHESALQDQSENESLCSSTSGCSSVTVPDARKSLRRQRRCSEPTIGLLASKFSHISGVHENAVRKASCDAVLSHVDEDCLKQLRSLQVEGQKLINQSLVMGIDVGQSGTVDQNGEKKDLSNCLLPPPLLRLNICSRTSCSSLSSPGTSPSGSSMSSLDSAFSQFSDYSVFTPTETSSPLDCAFQPQKKHGELSPEFNPFSGVHLGAGLSSFPNQASSSSSVGVRKESQKSPVTLHPSTWLKNGASTMKNWTLRKKERVSKQEEKKKSVVKITLEPQTDSSDASEDNLCQEQRQVLKTLMSTGGINAAETVQEGNFSSSRGGGQLCGSPLCAGEAKDKRLKALGLLAEQSKEEEEEEANSLFVQSHKRQLSNTFTQCTNPRAEHAHEPEDVVSAGHELFIKDSLSKTVISTDLGGQQVTNSKNNKSLPSTESKNIDDEPKRGFSRSPKTTKAVDDCLFKPDVNKCLQKSEEGTKAMVQNKKEWPNKHCSDSKFEELDQRFFAEESYV